MTEIQRAEQFLKSLYQAIWIGWYWEHDVLVPAELVVQEADAQDDYSASRDCIRISLSGHNLDDLVDAIRSGRALAIPNEPPETWPSWYQCLLHEMVHEYQHKAMKNVVTPEGAVLRSRKIKLFPGEGHEDDYYSAICDRADFMNYEHADLCRAL